MVAIDRYPLDIETVIVGVEALAEGFAHRIGTPKQVGDPVSGLNNRPFHIVLVEDIAVGINRPAAMDDANAGEDEGRYAFSRKVHAPANSCPLYGTRLQSDPGKDAPCDR